MPKKTDYHYWLYDHTYDSVGSFLDYVTGLVANTNIRLNILLVATRVSLEKELKSWTPDKFTVKVKNKEPVFSLDIVKEFSKSHKVTVRAVVVKYREPVYMIISASKASDFKTVIGKLMNKYYPTVSRIFLTNNEMRMIMDKLEESTGYKIHVDSSIGKKRIIGYVKKKESRVTYTNLPYREVFDEIIARDGWVQLVKYTAELIEKKDDEEIRTPKFSGIISRECFFSCMRDFSPVIETVIPYAIKFASIRNEYLRVRAESAPKLKPEPVVIKFDEGIFAEASKNKQYIEALAELDAASISIYHSNPYIHISLLDYLDGSSYDIWVLSSDRLVIIPQISASSASMARLLNHIYERIREGETEDYGEIKITR